MARLPLPDVASIAVDEVRVVPHPEGEPPRVSLLVARTQAGLRAYWNVCQHLPVALDSGVGQLPPGEDLVCLTHGARYRAVDGQCVAGPCRGGKLEALALAQDEHGGWYVEV